jgi:hypothetical protein
MLSGPSDELWQRIYGVDLQEWPAAPTGGEAYDAPRHSGRDLRRRKLSLPFKQTDTDQNGFLEQSDYERYAAHFAMQNGLALKWPWR